MSADACEQLSDGSNEDELENALEAELEENMWLQDTLDSEDLPAWQPPSSCSLLDLPVEVALRLFAFFDFRDLLHVSFVSRQLSAIAGEDKLWADLYVRHWPASQSRGDLGWKVLFINHYMTERADTLAGCLPELKPLFIEMESVRWLSKPKRARNEFSVIDTWRNSHDFTADPRHRCSGLTCTFFTDADVYICEKTGASHICGPNCDLAVVSDDDNLSVCPVSGMCFSASAHITEEEVADRGGEEGEDKYQGMLGECFAAGYSCVDDEEFASFKRRRFGRE
eukprot:GILJ01003337.1.p1 GENE.GILJ01003337.1~~GILJ01003337.1.p1  ORF type:complete len:308 (-),score=30.34 GILJ01003337.1:180-1025(-)